jgi:hypothetical protein
MVPSFSSTCSHFLGLFALTDKKTSGTTHPTTHYHITEDLNPQEECVLISPS